MVIEKTSLEGLFIIVPEISEDSRGFFIELFRKDKFREAGIDPIRSGDAPRTLAASNGAGISFVQQNISFSKKGVIRGLHFQWDPPVGKLIRVVLGRVFIVAADIRKKSPTLGKWIGIELSGENKKQVYVPPGFASGFCALDDANEVEYLYTAIYNPQGESNIIWNDPAIGIDWPLEGNPILSPRDAAAQKFEDWLKRPESDNF